MRGAANNLLTAARDIRVMRALPRGQRLTALRMEAHAFSLNLAHRLRRRSRLFADVDTTFRRGAPNILIQPFYLQNRINLAPRMTLTVNPVRQIKTLEQQIETRLLWRPDIDRAESSPAERIVRLVAAGVERQRGLSLHERHSAHSPKEVHNFVTLIAADHSDRSRDVVRNCRQPLPIEMVVHRTQFTAPAVPGSTTVSESEPPQVTERRAVPSPSPTKIPPLDSSYLRSLTDSVMEALDRRTIAAYERAGRRSA